MSPTIGIFGCTLAESMAVPALLETVQTCCAESDLLCQLVNAEYVAGPHHLLFATLHALQAAHYHRQRATDLGVEILLFAAAQRQIKHALPLMGVRANHQQLGGVLLGGPSPVLQQIYSSLLHQLNAKDTPAILDINSKAKEAKLQQAFHLSTQELETTQLSHQKNARHAALQKLIYERCALLTITR